MQRLSQFRSVISLASLDLDELRDQLLAATVQVILNGLALRIEPQPALALSVGRDTQVAHELAGCHESCAPS